MFALWLLKRKNVLLLSLANVLRVTDTCFICAFAMVTSVAHVTRHTSHVTRHAAHTRRRARCCPALTPLQAITYIRAVAAVVSVGSFMQPSASAFSSLRFHIGSLYLASHFRYRVTVQTCVVAYLMRCGISDA